MKVRNIKNSLWRRAVRLDSRNKMRRVKMLRTQKGTEEQLYLAAICAKLDEKSMKFATRQIKNKNYEKL